MRIKSVIILLFVVLTTALSAVPVEDFLIYNDFDKGFELAKAMNKNVMILFSSESCIYCKQLKQNVLPADDVSNFIINNYIIIELRADQNKTGKFDVENAAYSESGKEYTYEELFYLFGIRGVPATGFFDTEQQYLGTLPGFYNKDEYLKWLKFIQQKAYENGDINTFDVTNCCVGDEIKILEINAITLSNIQKTFPELLSYWSFEKFKTLNFLSLDTSKIYIIRDTKKEEISAFVKELNQNNLQNIYIVN